VKVSRFLIAHFAGAISAAGCTQETVQASTDCASLLAQYDQAASAAYVEQVSAAAAAREEGYELCLHGKTEEGSAKLLEAISQISTGAANARE
jgi:hypothetical protein